MCFNNLLQTKVNIVHAVSHYTFSLCCPALLSTSLLTLSVSSCERLCNGTASVGPFVRLSVPAYIDSQYAAATCCWLAAAQQVASSVICSVPRCKDQHRVRFCSSFFSMYDTPLPFVMCDASKLVI